MNILSIETSCDETSVSIVKCSIQDTTYRFEVLANNLLSQANMHAEFGGVFPSLAKREHAKAIVPLIEKTLRDAGIEKTEESTEQLKEAQLFLEREPSTAKDLQRLASFDTQTIDAIAVTVGPGLAPALWVGVNTARALSTLWAKPLIPVNHMHGHIFSGLFPQSSMFSLPALILLVSGGHTEILKLKADFSIEILGGTRDDAIGEAFDKSARLLGLGYPGGALISKEAKKHREAYPDHASKLFPRPMMNDDTFDMSYSGLKTAVLYYLRDNPIQNDDQRALVAREFEDAALDVVLKKTERVLETGEYKSLAVGGGVVANTELRRRLILLAETYNTRLHVPEMNITTDNSLMIAIAGFVAVENRKVTAQEEPERIEANANMRSNEFYQEE
jgi:N6-L-threonylcarbamoyladenine synthase